MSISRLKYRLRRIVKRAVESTVMVQVIILSFIASRPLTTFGGGVGGYSDNPAWAEREAEPAGPAPA
jgi:hypothetical protein